MTSAYQAHMPDRPAAEPLRSKSGWIVALGVVYVIAGLIALSSVVFATKVTVFVVGIMMLISGIAEMINAFQFKSWGKFVLWLMLGLLYIFAGLVTFENPLFAAAILTLLLGIALVISGVMRIFLAFSIHEGMAWTWVVLSGVLTFLLGLVILAHWPVSSLFVLGVLLGVDLLIIGIGWIFVGFGLKSRA
ncbi:MAG TPA: HdeD family acid-resistance protein [Xanthobacteraceae bacterium]|nr:HdeD family acid-resistance protein [Xanthobacteraceae bacterium]